MGDEAARHRRVEIVHESLLGEWPRLVRWRAQDEEGAQIRDQLRQTAQLWEERGRPDDLLWTDTSFKEFELWRERYPGGLTRQETAFTEAMVKLAARSRRRRRLAVLLVFVLLLSVATALAVFWLRSETARREAVAAERQAQASNLYGLARMQPEEEPAAFIAYATASLEQADNAEVRREIVKALWKGPLGFRLPVDSRNTLDFSADGRWLATASRQHGIQLWPSDGGPPTSLEGGIHRAAGVESSLPGSGASTEASHVAISPGGDLVAYTNPTPGPTKQATLLREVVLLSVARREVVRSLTFDEGSTGWFSFTSDGERVLTYTEIPQSEANITEIRSWPLDGGDPTLVARLEIRDVGPLGFTHAAVDPSGTRLAWTEGGRLFVARSGNSTFDPRSAVELEHAGIVGVFSFDSTGNRLLTYAVENQGAALRIWSLGGAAPRLARTLVYPEVLPKWPYLDHLGSRLAQWRAGVWDLRWPPDAAPLPLHFADRLFEQDVAFGNALDFLPSGGWIAGGNTASVSFWPLEGKYPHVLRGHERMDGGHLGGAVHSVRFTPDGRWLISAGSDGTIRKWPLDPKVAEHSFVLHQVKQGWGEPNFLALPPDGAFVAFGTTTGRVAILPSDGGPLRELPGFTSMISALAVGSRGRLVAAGAGVGNPEDSLVRVWDLQSGKVHILDRGNPERIFVNRARFTTGGDLWVEAGQYSRWDLSGKVPRLLKEGLRAPGVVRDFSRDGRWALVTSGGHGPLLVQDLDTGDTRALTTHDSYTGRAIFDPTGTIVISASSNLDGPISVGPVSGDEPHLLFGHETVGVQGLVGVDALALSPDGRWLASGGDDATIRLWPMPDPSQQPLQALPTEELVSKLRTLTNLRVVRDPDSFTGWKLEIGSFPGWEHVPTW